MVSKQQPYKVFQTKYIFLMIQHLRYNLVRYAGYWHQFLLTIRRAQLMSQKFASITSAAQLLRFALLYISIALFQRSSYIYLQKIYITKPLIDTIKVKLVSVVDYFLNSENILVALCIPAFTAQTTIVSVSVYLAKNRLSVIRSI